jgi:hypothetical protein
MKEEMPKQPVDDSETPDQGLSPTTGFKLAADCGRAEPQNTVAAKGI